MGLHRNEVLKEKGKTPTIKKGLANQQHQESSLKHQRQRRVNRVERAGGNEYSWGRIWESKRNPDGGG